MFHYHPVNIKLDDVLAYVAKTDINASVTLHCMTLADNGQGGRAKGSVSPAKYQSHPCFT